MTTDQPRTFGRRIWWIIRTTLVLFIIIALLAVVLGGLGYAGYLGVQELQRSNASLTRRIEANEQNLNSLRDLVNAEFAEGDPEQQAQIDQLRIELASLTRQLEAQQAARAEDAAAQAENVELLQGELEAAAAQNEALASELEDVQAALVALQSDLNASGSRIDDLGGDLDSLALELSSLADLEAEATAARDSQTADLQQSITRLQLWGFLTNAQLFLVDGDVVSAETAVSRAVLLAESLSVEPDTPADEARQRLQTRLSLAAEGFATDIPTVFQDLLAASRELAVLMVGPLPEAAVEGTPAPPEGETEAGTAVPTTAATLPADETPLPSPTPTPSP